MLSARGLLLLQSRPIVAISLGVCTLLAWAVSGCGDSGPRLRPLEAVERASAAVTGGGPTGEGDFPAVVAMGGCTATLVHPLLVVYAAHCGTATADVRFGAHANLPERTVATERCRSFPNAHLGDGTDLAYCVLAEPVLDIEPERILAGCELDELEVGEPATVVGFGVDREFGIFGEKRAAQLPISDIGDELFLAPGSADTCLGDSGGPVFVERRESSGGRQRRLVGVTSAGTDDICGRGIGHYVNLTRKLDWLEEDSQLDVTPCFNHGQWLPTPECIATQAALPAVTRSVVATDAGVSARDAGTRDASADLYTDVGTTGDAGVAAASGYLATCGSAFDPKPDDEAPTLKWTSPKQSQTKQAASKELGYAEFSLEVAAQDAGWGVKQVVLELLGDEEEVLFQRVDEVPPYEIDVFHVPPGEFTLRAEATDYAGNRRRSDLTLRISPPGAPEGAGAPTKGCSFSSRGSTGGWLAFALALCVAGSLRLGRRPNRAKSDGVLASRRRCREP